jgi:site-specific DNA-cytosine methylase
MGMGGGHIPMICKAPNGKIIENTNGIHQFKEVRTEIGKIKRSEYKKLTGLDSSKRGKEDKKYIPQNSGKSNCITTGLGVEGLISKNYQLRKLTPIECERLQSLSDNYTEGVSNTQRYKALGNGFNVEVIKHILKHLK